MARYRDSFRRSFWSTVTCAASSIALAAAAGGAVLPCILCTEARAIHLRRDGSVEVDPAPPTDTRACWPPAPPWWPLGGRQRWMHGELKPGLALANCQMRHVMPSDRALSTAGLKEADQILAEAGRR